MTPTVPAIDTHAAAFGAVAFGVLVTNPTLPGNPIVDANPAFERLTGYARDEVLGRDWGILRGPATDPGAIDTMRRSLAESREAAATLLVHRKDGSTFWSDIRIAPASNGRESTRLVATLTDATQRVAAEQRLRIAEERFRALFEDAPDAVAVFDADGVVRSVTPAVHSILGYAPEDYVGASRFDLIHPDDAPEVVAAFASLAAERGARARRTYRVRHADGSWRWVEAFAHNRFDDPVVEGIVVNFRDVTERMAAEDALRARADQLTALVATQADVAALWSDPEAVMRLVAQRAVALTGAVGAGVALADGDDVVYRVVVGSLGAAEGLRFPAAGSITGHCLLSGESQRTDDTEADARANTAAARRAVVRSLVVAPLRHGGRTAGVLAVGSHEPHAFGDAEQRLVELLAGLVGAALANAEAFAEAQASEARFRALVENAPDAIAVFEADGTVRSVTAAVERILGYRPEEFAGAPRFDLIHPDEAADVVAAFEAAAATPGGRVTREYRGRHADGSWRWLESIATNRLDDPAVGGIVVNFRDLTDRRRAEAALRASEARLQEAQAVGHVGGWEWDETAGRLWWSDETCRLYGLEPSGEPATFAQFLATVHPDDRERMVAEVDASEASGGGFEVEHRALLPDGRVRIMQNRGHAQFGPDGRVARLVGTVQDVTERREAEAALLAAKEEAEAANRAKSRFLSMVSHDVRNPMTAVVGYADLLREGGFGDLTPDQSEAVTVITDSARRMLGMLNDLLDYSRLEADRLDLAPEPVDVAELLTSLRAEFLAQAAAKGVVLATGLPIELPTLPADPVRLRQALANLVGNAVKFTDRGTVQLSAWTEGDALRIAVRDTGPGIAPEAMPRLFDEFAQADAATTRRHGGTGLGLAIARRLVGLHGGTLGVESAVGVGSTFTVVLPLHGTDTASRPPQDGTAHRD